jgi:hypothetical protein
MTIETCVHTRFTFLPIMSNRSKWTLETVTRRPKSGQKLTRSRSISSTRELHDVDRFTLDHSPRMSQKKSHKTSNVESFVLDRSPRPSPKKSQKMGRTIGLSFMTIDTAEAKGSTTNRLASIVSRSPIIHVELYFPQHNDVFSITQQKPSSFEDWKTFKRDGWMFYEISVTEDQLHAVRDYCKSHEGMSFDKTAMYWMVVPWFRPLFSDPSKALCSTLTSGALVAAKILPADFGVLGCTPASLHDYLVRHKIIFVASKPSFAAIMDGPLGNIDLSQTLVYRRVTDV